MVIRYWPAPDEDSLAAIAPDDDAGSWWPGVGRAAFAAAIAASVGLAKQAQSSVDMTQFSDDVPPQVLLSSEFEAGPRQLFISTTNRYTVFLGAAQAATPRITIDDIPDPTQPTVIAEPLVYLIGPGNWAAGTDEKSFLNPTDESWEVFVSIDIQTIITAPWAWTVGSDEAPKSTTRARDEEYWINPVPAVDPLVFMIAPWAWTAGSDEVPSFAQKIIDEVYQLDSSPFATPLSVVPPARAYLHEQSDSVAAVARMVEDEFWTNPLKQLPYWNTWPAPTYQQNDPAAFLFVAPSLPCVVEPALLGTEIIAVTFTPTALAQVIFTDVCGDPLP